VFLVPFHSEDDLTTLVRYMDPNADGSLSLEEIEEAFARASSPPAQLENEKAVGRVLTELDRIMASRKKR
jgi:hypothetical protein